MAKLSTDELLDAFKEMTLLELSRVREAVRGHLRRHRSRPGRRRGRPGAPRGGATAEAAEEQDEFDVILEGAGDKKIQVIKEVPCRSPASASRRPRTSVDGTPKRGPGEGQQRRLPRRQRPPSRAPAPQVTLTFHYVRPAARPIREAPVGRPSTSG